MRKFAPEEPVETGALVELEQDGTGNLYFIGPCAGGKEVVQDKREVMVITLQSPLGGQLKGRKAGDRVTLPGHKNEYRILSVS